MGSDDQERSPSGDPIYRHTEEEAKSGPVAAPQSTQLVGEHISAYLDGEVSVFHEIVSELVHLDVNIVHPSPSRPVYTLVTSGMSDRPMRAPKAAPLLTRAELLLCLPPDWPMTEKAFQDERNYWPIRLIKELARLPHKYSTWLWTSHTVPNGDPPEPYARNTRLCCALISTPLSVPDGFLRLEAGVGKTIYFHSVVPLYREEMEFKLAQGGEALNQRLAEAEVTELIDLKRVNVCKRSLFGLF